MTEDINLQTYNIAPSLNIDIQTNLDKYFPCSYNRYFVSQQRHRIGARQASEYEIDEIAQALNSQIYVENVDLVLPKFSTHAAWANTSKALAASITLKALQKIIDSAVAKAEPALYANVESMESIQSVMGRPSTYWVLTKSPVKIHDRVMKVALPENIECDYHLLCDSIGGGRRITLYNTPVQIKPIDPVHIVISTKILFSQNRHGIGPGFWKVPIAA